MWRSLILLGIIWPVFSLDARPYRALNTRTPRSTQGGNIEIGMRYQGLFFGIGNDIVTPGTFHQIAATLRWGVIDALELELQVAGLLFEDELDNGQVLVAAGDVRLATQLRLLRSKNARLGVFLGATLPTGPSAEDLLPPFFHDGTFDGEGMLLFELSPGRIFRLMINAGYLFQGVRDRGGLGDFNVPDAFRYDAAIGLHISKKTLLLLELNGRHYFDQEITPVWIDNADILELSPGIRIETSPRWVLEVGAGFSLNQETSEIHRLRLQAGFTYEFSTR